MVDAIVSPLLEQLISVSAEELTQQVKLVKGAEQEVEKLTSHLQTIQAVLSDAEQRQVKEESVRVWLGRLKDVSYDIEDVLDEWITARRRLQMKQNAHSAQKQVSSCFPASSIGFKKIILRQDIAVKIKGINKKLGVIATQKDMFKFVESGGASSARPGRVQSTSFIDEEEICGRVGEKNELLSKLLCESSEQQKGLHIISIVGMGGIGKTTLAQLVCNHEEVIRKFDKILWVCVSETFEEFRVAKAMVEALDGHESHLGEFQSLLRHIYESIAGKSFLLVLDDVWDGNYVKWEPFYHCLKNGLHGSKILVTTRKESVACMMGSLDIISIKELAEEECWLLFNRIAFHGRAIEECEKLEQIGQQIASRCKGLPLAAKVIGSLMRSKKTEEEWCRILNNDLWKIEEIEKGVLSPLLLSYNDLPSRVKRCFSYCAVFPKDFNIMKEKLISMWMAQGYFSAEQDEEMDIIGEEYFNILATRSFFQEFKRDHDNLIVACKMHDIVHDFAQFVSQNECSSMEINGSKEPNAINSLDEKVCHLMLVIGLGASFPVSTCRIKRMRSLFISGNMLDNSSLNGKMLKELFGKLTSLRALDIGNWSATLCSSILDIPRNIEKLVHLRYLNLSCVTLIRKLPETLCELYNLEKLDISYCINLKALPQGIGKLINMKHLLNERTDSLGHMPAGIARLPSLRTLDEFHVCGGEGVDGRKGCRLESLKNLELLQVCGIRRLGNVSDVDEAKRLKLDKKKYLSCLRLWFDVKESGGRRKNEHDQLLLEALQPPFNLKELFIGSYGGNTVSPSWMMSLTNLRSLNLHLCENCEQLPPLGKLPSLEKLYISDMNSVKRVGNEILGIESDHHDSSSSSSSSVIIAFPKLQSLFIEDLPELEEWDYGITRTGHPFIDIMPRLSSLAIAVCPKLKALPDHIHQTTTLKGLSIWGCDLLEERYRKGEGEDWPKISHIPNIYINYLRI